MTPKRFRTLGTGIALPDTDAALLPVLAISSQMVNAYCSAPTDHDFRGGSVTDEQHEWEVGNDWARGTTRVYPYHRPLRSASRLRIDLTNTQYVTLSDPNTLYVNKAEGWIEPVAVALTTAGMFGWALLPGIGLRTPTAKIDYVYGWSLSATNETLASISGGTLQAMSQFWDSDVTPVIKKDGLELSSSQYSIDYDEGIVTVSNYTAESVYTASYTHPLPLAIARATALIATDVLAQASNATKGLIGIQQLTVEEISIRQSSSMGLYGSPVNGAAKTLLAPFVYLSWG